MQGFRFEHIEYLWLLLAVPLALLLFYAAIKWKNKKIKAIGDKELVLDLIEEKPVYKNQIKFFLLLACFIFLVLGMANPQVGIERQEIKRKGIDLFIALDVSNSMLAEDLEPNRLERAKQFTRRLLDKAGQNRIGIIVFAGNAYLQMPLSIDAGAAKMYLRTVSTDIVPTQGTAIADAIELAIASAEQADINSGAVLVISDGEDHEQGATEMADQAQEKGFTVFTVGVGSGKGAPVPEYINGIRRGYKSGPDNNVVLSKLNEETLREIAQAGGGQYFSLGQGGDPLNNVINAFNQVEQKELTGVQYDNYNSYFQIPLAIAALLLLIELFITRRRSKTFYNWKIFKV